MEISFNDRRVDLVEEGIDLAVRMGDLEDSAALVARRLYTQRSVLCAAPSYLEARGRPRTVEDLAQHAVIAYGRDGNVQSWELRDSDGHPRKFAPRGQLVLGHGEPILDAVLAGCGIPSDLARCRRPQAGRTGRSCRIASWKTSLPMPSGQ